MHSTFNCKLAGLFHLSRWHEGAPPHFLPLQGDQAYLSGVAPFMHVFPKIVHPFSFHHHQFTHTSHTSTPPTPRRRPSGMVSFMDVNPNIVCPTLALLTPIFHTLHTSHTSHIFKVTRHT